MVLFRPPRRAAVAALMSLSLALGASGAVADPSPPTPPDPADRLTELSGRIADTEREVDLLKANLLSVAARVASEETAYAQTVASAVAEQERLSLARHAYDQAKRELNDRVRAAYMGGAGGTLEALFGAPTLGDLALVMETQNRQAQQDGALAVRTGDLQQQAADSERALSQYLARQSELLARLDQRRQELTDRFAQQQVLLDQLVAGRRELQRLIRQQDLPGQHSTGMTISFDQWAGRFLQELTVPDCRNNRIVVVAWETAEYTAAAWNPLATTYDMRGATQFNDAGVRNYMSLQQGLDATVATLLLGVRSYGYGAIIAALAECAPPEATAEAIRKSSWCHGCAGGHYVTSLIPSVEAYFDGTLG
jgi:peptidoglycan hydrolase CwlO-like protein